MKITIDRPPNMKHPGMPGNPKTYEFTVLPEAVEQFRKGGRLVIEIEESADLLAGIVKVARAKKIRKFYPLSRSAPSQTLKLEQPD